MPAEPIRDGVVSQAGKERAEIAELYRQGGDDASAAEWYLQGARFSHASGDIMGAVVLVRRAIQLEPQRDEALSLYATLWRLLGLGDTPDPVT